MKLLAICFGLLAVGVFCEEEIDYSGVKSRVLMPNNFPWQPPQNYFPIGGIGGAQEDSSEHGITPGTRSTNCQCGWANRVKGRIVGGRVHGQNEYPFIVGIAARNQPTRPFCGGTLISPWHIVTAAHCTMNQRDLVISVGGYNRAGERPTLIAVSHIMDHEQFSINTLRHDISVLLLAKPVTQSATVGPACLPSQSALNLIGKKLRIIGWGAEQFRGAMTMLPKKTDITVIDETTCSRAWPQNIAPRQMQQICTLTHGTSACQGDSGGPVVYRDPETNRYELVGAVSFGAHCQTNKPSIQTGIFAYLPWIKSIVQATTPGQMLCAKV